MARFALLSAFNRQLTTGRLEEIRAHRDAFDKALRPASANFAPHQALDILREKLPADGILAYDVGAHTHQIASQWRTDRPSTLLATNGWSSMGYGMPAAYAAKLVHPDRAVVGVVGDGCFQMTAGELALARRLNLAVPVIVLNDGWLGLMKVKQEKRKYPLSGVLSRRAAGVAGALFWRALPFGEIRRRISPGARLGIRPRWAERRRSVRRRRKLFRHRLRLDHFAS